VTWDRSEVKGSGTPSLNCGRWTYRSGNCRRVEFKVGGAEFGLRTPELMEFRRRDLRDFNAMERRLFLVGSSPRSINHSRAIKHDVGKFIDFTVFLNLFSNGFNISIVNENTIILSV
jgi:hypothetical protein